MLLKGFENIKTLFPVCFPEEAEKITASTDCTDDISEVFPYPNAIMKGTIYDPKNNTLHFKLSWHSITLHAKKLLVAALEDNEDVEKVLENMKSVINITNEKRNEIKSSYKTRAQLNVLGIYKLFSRTNCGKSGEPTYMDFSAKLIAEEASIEKCSPLFTDEFTDVR